MALILGAYRLSCGAELFMNLAKLEGEDLERVRQIILETIPNISVDKPILEEILSVPKIPEQHIALRAFQNEVMDFKNIMHLKDTNYGALAMFKVLAQMWPKIAPTPPQPQM